MEAGLNARAVGEFASAEQLLRRALDAAPDDYRAYQFLGALLIDRDDKVEGLEILERGADIAGPLTRDTMGIYNNLANALQRRSKSRPSTCVCSLIERASMCATVHSTTSATRRTWRSYRKSSRNGENRMDQTNEILVGVQVDNEVSRGNDTPARSARRVLRCRRSRSSGLTRPGRKFVQPPVHDSVSHIAGVGRVFLQS